MQRILVVNSKGGCGKTTLTTNLASYYAAHGYTTVLMDHDPQGSGMRWLSQRPVERPRIYGIAPHQMRSDMTRSFQMKLPPDTERVIIDVPAGLSDLKLAEHTRQVDAILVPVLPSPIDIHATAHFIQVLLLAAKVRSKNIRLAVVANRVREHTEVFHKLERFLATLKLPFVAKFRDTQNYIRAAQDGIGIFEMTGMTAQRDRAQWSSLIAWLDQNETMGQEVAFLSSYRANAGNPL